MIRENTLKNKLTSGGKVFGTWSMTASPVVANILGSTGMDFVIIDMEHGAMSFETAEQQLYAIEVTGCTPIIRIGENSEANILHALEIGVQSIMVSHISTPEEARLVVQRAKYYPEGDRGLSPFTRNHGYSDSNIAEKLQHANKQIFIGILVEGEEGLNKLDKICEISGIDMIYLGVYDISQSVGVHGDVKHPKVIKAVREFARIINSYGLIAGSVARDREYLELLIDSGYSFLSYRVDCAILMEGYEKAAGWFREFISER